MSKIIRIPANSCAYIDVARDAVHDYYDIIDHKFGYLNPVVVTFPPAWGYWKMNEDAGNARLDSSGNAHHLIEIPDPVPRTTGKIGYAAYFDGTPDGTQKNFGGDGPDLRNNAHFMLSWWQKHHIISAPNWSELYPVFGDGASCGANIGNLGDHAENIYVNPYTRNRYIESGYIITPDIWHFVVVYYDGIGLYLEIDNMTIGSDLGVSGALSAVGNVSWGGLYEDGQISIAIDEFGYWVGDNADLAIAQRSQLWNNGAGWSPY